ncbi:MAG TPA: SRPBCC domain-containing protein [Burkholderiales bacterium]
MPERAAKFTVNAPPHELWKFLRDFEALCTCIPGVERVRLVDPRTAELTVKEKVGVVPLIVTLRAQIESEEPPKRLHASARAEHLTMSIDVALRGTATGTELTSVFDVKGEGQLKAIVDRLFERRATERTAQFAECLGKRFGAVPPALAAAPPAGSLWRWLARLWQRLLGGAAPPPR